MKSKSLNGAWTLYYAESGKYNVNMHGGEYIDGNTKEAISFKNVLVLYTKQWYYTDGTHKIYDTIGSGEVPAREIKDIEIEWASGDITIQVADVWQATSTVTEM